MAYAELQCKTNYSFLRGASHPHELVRRAHELGLCGLAITDRDGLYGMPKAYLAAKEIPSFKFLVGGELTLESLPPMTLIVQDRTAYGLLSRLFTESFSGKEKGCAALSWEKFLEMASEPAGKGLIALPTDGEEVNYGVLKEIFGENLFIPLHRFLDGCDKERTERALFLKEQFNIGLVATNDVHSHERERKIVQDLLTSIRENIPLSQLGSRLFSNGERYLKSSSVMKTLFADLPDTVDLTVEIAASCHFSPSELRYVYPSEWIPTGHTAQSYLEHRVREGTQERYPQGVSDEVVKQIVHELDLIKRLNFADYFLTLWEIVAFARSQNILCQGRGSAANSVVCFCLGITAIDPVRMNLLFERFISVERGEPPDIDVDFEHERREEVIQHIYEKYGRHRAAMVAACITYRPKSAVRDVCRSLEIPFEQWQRHPQVEMLAKSILGFPRHLGIHSGGFTLSATPITEIVPVEPARMAGRTIVQWDKNDLDALGLLKVDVLSLGMLTAIRKALALVGKYTLATIPPEDPATYAMIRQADSVGTFQIESRAQMNMSQRLLPTCYYDLVVQIALVRPGPIMGNMVHPYLKRRQGLEAAAVPHPLLEPILRRTLGVPIFQEQVMKMAIVLAKFTPGEADQLRKAIGAWRSSGSIEVMGERLRRGLLESGLPRDYVDLIFEQLKGFAEYGFPESHSASFAILAYASAYLKCHHPAEFAVGLVNSQPMGFYAPHTILDDAKRHGVGILPLDPNRSQWDFTLEEGKIRVGWRVVRHIHEREVDPIIKEKPFASLHDFLARTQIRLRVLEQMAMGDAFRCFGLDQRAALWEILRSKMILRREEKQHDLFASLDGKPANDVAFAVLDAPREIYEDYETYGLSARAHPMEVLRKFSPHKTIAEVRSSPSGRAATAAGLVLVRQKPPTAKGTVFACLEDETGILDLILHQKTFERCKEVFLAHAFLKVRGKIQRERQAVHLLVQGVEPYLPEELGDIHVNAHEWH